MTYVEAFLQEFKSKNASEPEFVQSVEEVVGSLGDLLEERLDLQAAGILERMVEAERIISFRVTWTDDKGKVQVNRGYRVQFSSVLGPYKGGVRFHPSVNLSILKFLGFEQVFKNSLTGLWLGGAKGGSNFNPKGKSDAEIMRFCQALMLELASYIGADIDVLAGDIGVGSRELRYLSGAYKKLAHEFRGAVSGQGVEWGGSHLRTEATGYGLLYFVQAMLRQSEQDVSGKSVVISGSGNVAQFAAEKATQIGAKVLTMSDSSGYVLDESGITSEKLEYIKELKNQRHGRIEEYAKHFEDVTFVAGAKPWGVKADIYLPCATQNEIEATDARMITEHHPLLLAEGANMPSTPEAVEIFQEAKLLYAPGKASNAGGVSVSGLEMAQNSARLSWSQEEVDKRLKVIMDDIHGKCVHYGSTPAGVDYLKGANLAGFIRVADAMLAQGVI